MSLSFSKEDVHKHLQDLGYSNISNEQLREFMTDLKRLIRYEEKQKRIEAHLKYARTQSRCDESETTEKGHDRKNKGNVLVVEIWGQLKVSSERKNRHKRLSLLISLQKIKIINMLTDTATSALIHHTLLLLHQNMILMRHQKRQNSQRNDRKVAILGHSQLKKASIEVKKI